MTTFKMSAKRFLNYSSGKAAASAHGFLSKYRDFLLTGEVSHTTASIIEKLDAGEILPTPALKEVQQAVMIHIIASEEAKMVEAAQPKVRESAPKNWTVSIYNARGEIQTYVNPQGNESDLIKGFENNSDAERWADRRLFDGSSDWYAEVSHHASGQVIQIERNDAMARILKGKKGPAIHAKPQSTGKLSFGVKCSESRCSFSRG